MPDRTHQRPNKANAEANALASWDNEGGAAKGAPQKDRLHHTADLKSQIARFLHKHKDQEIG